jgi:hypothetical protein
LQFLVRAGGEEGYRVVLEKILPITATMLEDEKLEVTWISFAFCLVAYLPILSKCKPGKQKIT